MTMTVEDAMAAVRAAVGYREVTLDPTGGNHAAIRVDIGSRYLMVVDEDALTYSDGTGAPFTGGVCASVYDSAADDEATNVVSLVGEPTPDMVSGAVYQALAFALTEQQRLEEAVQAGLDAFWDVIAKRYPEATSGDMDPLSLFHLDQTCENIVKLWLDYNATEEEADPDEQ